MSEEDLVLKKKISNYFDYVLRYGIDIKENDYVEIVTTSYIPNYLSILLERLRSYNANVYITYTDGDDLESIINGDYNAYIDSKISMYHELILKNFKRLSIISPFVIPISRSKNAIEYLKQNYKFLFVREYFLKHPHTIFAVANDYWAHKLQIKTDSLWEMIFDYSYRTSELEYFKNEITYMNIKALHFKTELGTDLYVGIPKKSIFLGKKWGSGDAEYQPNIPCLEIFISPNKFEVEGKLVSSKPLYFGGLLINNYSLTFKNGKVIDNENLNEILNLDPTLSYAGEIALVLEYKSFLFYSTIMDENSGCHLALGNGYTEGAEEIDLINKSKYHIDLVFGTNETICDAILEDGSIVPLIKNGKLVRKK